MRTTIYPIPVKRALLKLGTDIKDARIRRRISAETMSERAGITRPTLLKVEKGDPSTSIGIYTKVLFVLGMIDKLADIADIRNDETGLALESMDLPKYAHNKKI